MDPNSLTPQQQQAVMVQAQNEANQQIMQNMMDSLIKQCFEKCAVSATELESQAQTTRDIEGTDQELRASLWGFYGCLLSSMEAG